MQVDWAAEAETLPLSDPAALDLVTPEGMRRSVFPAMGTTVSVLVPTGQSDRGIEVVRQVFEEWERTFSRFLPESELSRVNARPGEWVPVGPLFIDVLSTALAAARATDGVFEPTLLHQLINLGYDRTFSDLPSTIPPSTRRPVVSGGWQSVRLSPAGRAVMIAPGTGLDFGGIAKGMAVDAAVDRLVTMGVGCAAVDAGGDLAVHSLPSGRAAWDIAVDVKEGREVVSIAGGGLATSSQARRRWTQGGAPRHHILDPRTGEPADRGLWSVTVAAGTCTQAEVAAKAAFILGPWEGAAFLTEHNLGGLMVLAGGTTRRVGPWRGIRGSDAG